MRVPWMHLKSKAAGKQSAEGNYTISVQFQFDIYTPGMGTYLSSATYYVENIPPHTDYAIYVNSADVANYVSFYIDWTVVDAY